MAEAKYAEWRTEQDLAQGLEPRRSKDYSIHDVGRGDGKSKKNKNNGAMGQYEYGGGVPGDIEQSEWRRSRSKEWAEKTQGTGYGKTRSQSKEMYDSARHNDLSALKEAAQRQRSNPAVAYHFKRSQTNNDF